METGPNLDPNPHPNSDSDPESNHDTDPNTGGRQAKEFPLRHDQPPLLL